MHISKMCKLVDEVDVTDFCPLWNSTVYRMEGNLFDTERGNVTVEFFEAGYGMPKDNDGKTYSKAIVTTLREVDLSCPDTALESSNPSSTAVFHARKKNVPIGIHSKRNTFQPHVSLRHWSRSLTAFVHNNQRFAKAKTQSEMEQTASKPLNVESFAHSSSSKYDWIMPYTW